MNAFMSYKFSTKNLTLDENDNNNDRENENENDNNNDNEMTFLIIYKNELLSI